MGVPRIANLPSSPFGCAPPDHQRRWFRGHHSPKAGEGPRLFPHRCSGGTARNWQSQSRLPLSFWGLANANRVNITERRAVRIAALPLGRLPGRQREAGADPEPMGSSGVDGSLEWQVGLWERAAEIYSLSVLSANGQRLEIPPWCEKWHSRYFFGVVPRWWNELPNLVQSSDSLSTFQKRVCSRKSSTNPIPLSVPWMLLVSRFCPLHSLTYA